MQRLLTQAAIARLRPGDYLADNATPGLRVVASKSRRAFVYRYRDAGSGKLKQVTLGDASIMPIADARDSVRALQRARKEGASPQRLMREPIEAAVVATAQAGYTVDSLIADYAREHLARTKRGAERERTLRHDLNSWRNKEAASIRRTDIKSLVEDIANRAPDTAGRVLRELRAAYLHAADRERIPETANPTVGVRPPKASRYVPRSRAFTEGEWRAWLKWLPKSALSVDVQDALLLVAYTASRPGEVTAARWADIDLKTKTWTIRERKRGGEHVVYLSAPAVAILKRRANAVPFVFPSPSKRDRPIRQHALVWSIANNREACPVAHWTAHDLRRSAATLLQSKGARFEVLRRVLGHYSTRNPTDIYARHGFDAEAREAWTLLGTTLARWSR